MKVEREREARTARHAGETSAPEGRTDGIVGALGERVRAQLDRGSSTLRLALAETRLAASSAALLLGIAIAGAGLAIVTWVLLAALIGHLLWLLGLPTAAVLALLLLVHVVAAVALALIARRLARDLGFAHTRQALSEVSSGGGIRATVSDVPTDPTASRDRDSARGDERGGSGL